MFNRVVKCPKQCIILRCMIYSFQSCRKVFRMFMQFLCNEKSEISDTFETLSQLALDFDYKRTNLVVEISIIAYNHCITLHFADVLLFALCSLYSKNNVQDLICNINCVTLKFIVLHLTKKHDNLRISF